ncbi:hypothetical protein BV22DRAFT_1049118 [Leucogyrophana mollusca]|uniref:Uncharacterized protein n=1 Tax=Leucogyrophana mollusca TaxID=85980 RepID=A0ACB8BAB2_9AGAM|nr:hypothetical protein BV22DRAFT_1049118 [Leucogyrophana mollusca]
MCSVQTVPQHPEEYIKIGYMRKNIKDITLPLFLGHLLMGSGFYGSDGFLSDRTVHQRTWAPGHLRVNKALKMSIAIMSVRESAGRIENLDSPLGQPNILADEGCENLYNLDNEKDMLEMFKKSSYVYLE